LNFIKLQELDPDLDFYTPVIIANEDLIDSNPELVRKFLKATAQGYEYAIENPEASADLLLKHAPEIDRDLAVASQKYLAAEYISDAARWGEMEQSMWDNFAKWMYDNELISKKFESEEAFTNEYLPE